MPNVSGTRVKVLVIHNHYQQPGGEQAAVQNQVGLLEQHGHQVVTWFQNNDVIAQFGLLDRARFFPHAVFSARVYQQTLDLARRERPDVAHVHNVFPLLSPAVYWALKAAAVPIVQTIHNFRLLCPNGLFYTRGHICELCKHGNTTHAVRLRCYRNSYALSALYALSVGLHRALGTFARIERFVVLTRFAADKLVEGGVVEPERISVLGNFLPEPLPAPGQTRKPWVVFIGRLSPEKGVETLIEAARWVPELQFKILGDGPDRTRLERQAHGLANVEFVGHVGAAKWDWLRQAVAVVVPSLCYEQFPYAVLEAMAAGTAVVASRQGGLCELVEEGVSGLLFEPGRSEDLADKLRSCLDARRGAEFGRAGRLALERRWTASRHHDGLIEICRQAINAASS
jgi:glycosyltransferase involved in cell wall biosynthesis